MAPTFQGRSTQAAGKCTQCVLSRAGSRQGAQKGQSSPSHWLLTWLKSSLLLFIFLCVLNSLSEPGAQEVGALPVGFSLVTPVIFKEAWKEELQLAWTRGVQREQDPSRSPWEQPRVERGRGNSGLGRARGVEKRGGEGEVAAGALGLF